MKIKKINVKKTLSLSPVFKLFLFFTHFEPNCSYKLVLIKEKEYSLYLPTSRDKALVPARQPKIARSQGRLDYSKLLFPVKIKAFVIT